ncbi:salivary cystatin-L2 isoform X2 [Rhipicephalus sanguineus]|uniref:salivary cystatin-L2 isoform X2 n=1 Tax=Rhipicephalus sanguineus TaxID=34632 RepID=UPI001893F1C7|nr:salivary cystatin-L2 isoform X2 [Rhipicephalus sanguineus]
MKAALFVLIAVAAQCSAMMTGGWTEQNPSSDPKYLRLAHFAIAQQTTGLPNYQTVLRLLKVQTQVINGVNYKVIFETAPSNCTVADGPYSSELCKPTTNQASAACTAIIFERQWENYRELTSFRCHK